MNSNFPSNQIKIAVDVQELTSEVILDSLLAAPGEVFRTARGRRAILIGSAALTALKRKLSLDLDEGEDGTFILRG